MKYTALLLFSLLAQLNVLAQTDDKNTLVKRELTTSEAEFFRNVAFQTTMRAGRVINYAPELSTIYIILESIEKTFYSEVSITVRNGIAYAKGVATNRGLLQNNSTATSIITLRGGKLSFANRAHYELSQFMDNIVPKKMAEKHQIETLYILAENTVLTSIERRQILQQIEGITSEKADKLIVKVSEMVEERVN